MHNDAHEKLKVLLLSREGAWQGGVVNYFETLTTKLSGDIDFERLYIGARWGKSGIIRGVFNALTDSARLWKKVRGTRFDVVNINPSLDLKSVLRDGLFMLILATAGYGNTLVFFRGWHEKTAERIRCNRLFADAFKTVFGKAAAILVLSSSARKTLVDMGFDEARILVSTTMFDAGILSKAKPSLGRPPRRILFLSRLEKEKGVYELLEAFRTISGNHGHVDLVVAGDGLERPLMEKWVLEHGLSHRVRFPGYLRRLDKGRELEAADIFILPTYYREGCPNALLEAMGAGLALIVTPVGGIPDVVEEEQNAIVVDVRSPEAISAGLERLLKNPRFCERMRNNNYKKAHREYEASVVARKMLGLYREIAGSAR